MKTTLIILISIVVGFTIAWSIPIRREKSIIVEWENCEKIGGVFRYNQFPLFDEKAFECTKTFDLYSNPTNK